MSRFRARRLEGLVQSDIRRMTRECDRVGGINLGQGVCDLPTPPLVRDGAIAAIEAQQALYSYPEGIAELREAIARKLERDNGLRADPASEIVVTVGATGAYVAALNALLDPGDGILLFEPYYGYHLNGAVLAGLVPEFCTLAAPDFTVTEEHVRASVSERTRAVVICTPSNPSGKMFTREELAAIGRVARERDLLVLTDEIYEYIRYDGREHVSPATLDDLADRTVTIMGLSKTFSITGWRLGYAVAREELAGPITLANDLMYICAPTPLQYGVARGFDANEEFYSEMQADYARKRERICGALEKSGLNPYVPQGAYYVLADVRSLGFETSREAALDILERARVASVPGSSFYSGPEGEGLVRFCYATEDPVLDEACRRIEAYRRT